MPQDRRTLNALAALLPAGTLGLSASLATADARAATTSGPEVKLPGAVHERLDTTRKAVSGIVNETPQGNEPFLKVDPEKRLAWWGNGWHNGGWGNWGNGWHNWGNGWGNGWHNGWHNW